MSVGGTPLIGMVDDAIQELLKRNGQPAKIGAGTSQPAPQVTAPSRFGASALTAPAAQPALPQTPVVGAPGGTAPFMPAKIGASQPAAPSIPKIGAAMDTYDPSQSPMPAGQPDYAAQYAAVQDPTRPAPDAGKPSMLRKIGGIALGAGIGAFNPQAGAQIGSSIVNGPRNELMRDYNQQELAANQQRERISKEAGLAHTGSQIEQEQAQAAKEKADAAVAGQPKPVPAEVGHTYVDDKGNEVAVMKDGSTKVLGPAQEKPQKDPSTKEQIQSQINAEMAKPKPDQNVIKGLQNRLKAIDPLAEDRLKDAENRAATAASKGDKKTDLGTREKVLTYYKPAQDADVRLQLMEKNEQDALKGNQQAMVNLLANHIALTMGLPRGKVPRVSYQMFQEAQQSAPILQRAEAHFDKDGYLTGVVLSPDQMKAMVALAHETRDAEWQSSNSSADYIGIDPNDRPKSIYQGAAGGGAQQQGPAVGAVEGGYRFKGGNPADKNSWEKVK